MFTISFHFMRFFNLLQFVCYPTFHLLTDLYLLPSHISHSYYYYYPLIVAYTIFVLQDEPDIELFIDNLLILTVMYLSDKYSEVMPILAALSDTFLTSFHLRHVQIECEEWIRDKHLFRTSSPRDLINVPNGVNLKELLKTMPYLESLAFTDVCFISFQTFRYKCVSIIILF